MEKIQIIVQVDQKAALLAGNAEYGYTLVTVNPEELTAVERETLASCNMRTLEGNGWSLGYGARNFYPQDEIDNHAYADTSLETVKQILADVVTARNAKAAEQAAKHEARVAEYISKPVEKFIAFSQDYSVDGENFSSSSSNEKHSLAGTKSNISYALSGYITESEQKALLADPRTFAKQEEIKAFCAAHNEQVLTWAREEKAARAERKRLSEEKAAGEKAEKEASAARRKDQLNAWVAEHGTDNQKKRHELNLLPEEEILDGIRAAAFAPLDAFPRYEKLTKGDIDCVCQYDINPKFSADDAESATAEEFESMERIATAIKAVHPQAEVILRTHEAYCADCYDKDDDGNESEDVDRTVHRKSALVKIGVGELEFSREYAIP